MELWFIHFALVAILIASSLYLWWKTRETGPLFICAGSLMSSLYPVFFVLGDFTLFWLFLVVTANFFIIGIPGALRAYRKLTREFATESKKGLPRFMLKLARKYGPVKAALVSTIITEAMCAVVLFPVFFVFSGFTLIESFLIAILSAMPLNIIVGRVLHRLLVETLKQDRESENDIGREKVAIGGEIGEVDP